MLLNSSTQPMMATFNAITSVSSGDQQSWELHEQQQAPTFLINPTKPGVAIFPDNIQEVLNLEPTRFRVLQPMPYSLSVFIPSLVEQDTTPYRDQLMAILTEFGSGASAIPAIGFYRTTSGALVRDKNWLVWAWIAPDRMGEALKAVLSFCQTLKTELAQEAILLQINGRPILDTAV